MHFCFYLLFHLSHFLFYLQFHVVKSSTFLGTIWKFIPVNLVTYLHFCLVCHYVTNLFIIFYYSMSLNMAVSTFNVRWSIGQINDCIYHNMKIKILVSIIIHYRPSYSVLTTVPNYQYLALPPSIWRQDMGTIWNYITLCCTIFL